MNLTVVLHDWHCCQSQVCTCAAEDINSNYFSINLSLNFLQLGTSALPEDLNERLITAISNMQTTYAKATICDYKDRSKCDLHVEPGKVTN